MSLRIIAVDDDASTLELLTAMVEPLGYEVLAVGDSRDATRLIEQEKFDGAIVDVLMPHVDGFQLTQCIRNFHLNRQVPIIMLTSQDDAETMRKGFNAGVSFFLGKPFTRERIAALFAAARGPMLKEKRLHVRLPYRTTVDCKWFGQRQGHFKAESIDICEVGMLLGPSGGLEIGQEIELEFEMPTAKTPLRSRAKILRRDKTDQIAVEFMNISIKDRDAIRTFINARVMA